MASRLRRSPSRPGVRIVSIVDERHVPHLFPRRAHLGLGHAGDSFGSVLVTHTALVRDRQCKHGVSEIVKASHRRLHRHAGDLDHSQSVRPDLPPIRLEIGAVIESRDDIRT